MSEFEEQIGAVPAEEVADQETEGQTQVAADAPSESFSLIEHLRACDRQHKAEKPALVAEFYRVANADFLERSPGKLDHPGGHAKGSVNRYNSGR